MTELKTSKIQLVEFSEKYLTEKYVSWLKDKDVVRFSEQRHFSHSLESCKSHIKSLPKNDQFFAIIWNEDNSHIGNCHMKVNLYNKTADLSIMIGDKDKWGKGIATEVYELLETHSFETLNLRKITAGTMSLNLGMINVLKKRGFVSDGIMKKHLLFEDKEVDVHLFAKFK